jgi:hypothetical protein
VPAARYFFAVVLSGVAVGYALTRDEPRQSPPAVAPPTGVPAEPFGYEFRKDARYVGNLSCASGPCHGGAGLHGGAEYKMWASGDPHFRAYAVLTNPRSVRMVQLLHGDKPGRPQPAYEQQRCLVCHSPEMAEPTVAAHGTGSVPEDSRGRGVGCESCHGPAEHWLNTHYRNEFKQKSPEQRARDYGYYPTKDLGFRVTLCASCHVGDAGREVDHDLIAAGHPRLAFEYTGYHHSPKYEPFRHW